MDIAVLGPGGVGGFLAGALTRAGENVTLIAREETAATLSERGVRVESVRLGNFEARPAIATQLDRPVDVLFVATKANGLRAALDRVRAEPQLVVPLLNGLDHLAVLRERFGTRAVAGSIRIESDRPEPGRLVQTSPFLRIDLASDDPRMGPALEELVATLERADIPARVGDSEPQVMWGKLVRLNALACTTSAADLPLGAIRDDGGWRGKLVSCVSEGVAIASAEGASVSYETVMTELTEAHASLTSSMQRDIAAGREPELDAIAGAVLRAGTRHGFGCPVITELAWMIAERAEVEPPNF